MTQTGDEDITVILKGRWEMSLKQGFGRRAGNPAASSSSHPILLCDLCVWATLRPHRLALSSSTIVSLPFLQGRLIVLFCPFFPFLDWGMQPTPLCFFHLCLWLPNEQVHLGGSTRSWSLKKMHHFPDLSNTYPSYFTIHPGLVFLPPRDPRIHHLFPPLPLTLIASPSFIIFHVDHCNSHPACPPPTTLSELLSTYTAPLCLHQNSFLKLQFGKLRCQTLF